MSKSAPADQTITIRLPAGIRDRLVAATGQPFSRLMRFMVMELLKDAEAKMAARVAAGQHADPREAAHAEVIAVVKESGL